MISDFQSFLESIHYSEQWLLFVFFKSESSSASTQKPVPNSETDVVFENYHLVNKSLSFDDVIKKELEKSELDIDPKKIDKTIKDLPTSVVTQIYKRIEKAIKANGKGSEIQL